MWREVPLSLSPCSIGVPRCTFLRLRQQMPAKLLPLASHRIAPYRMPFSLCLLAYKNGRMTSKPNQYSSLLSLFYFLSRCLAQLAHSSLPMKLVELVFLLRYLSDVAGVKSYGRLIRHGMEVCKHG